MASYNHNASQYQSHISYPPRQAASFNPAASMSSTAPTPPAGTFMPGTKVQVGSHRVVIEKYLSEGGFAHVYVVKLPHPVDGSDKAVLKRVAVPDKVALAGMRTEVETMKKLKGHRHIVTYIDSHASQLREGGYEVFLLMEYCTGGGLIDFMNTRLQNRLTEPEILKIFSDVTEGLACMHYLKPPLLHRDLKIENVLITTTSRGARIFKLCDFGSAAPPRPAAKSAAEGQLIEEDIQRHTTLQYRSPEMIDVYRKHPIDEKSDIWALGVFLYKLCYYTTPFEEAGQMAILNAKFSFPAHPTFSDRLKRLIASMLRELPQKRPTVYEVLREACSMQGKEVPIRDIYAHRTESEARRYQELPPSPSEAPNVGAVFSPPVQETQIIPEIAPMRRGRPTRPVSQTNSGKPSPSPRRDAGGDPFAVLDGSKSKKGTADELSGRFPTLDQFSLLHEKGEKFEFEPTVTENKTEDDGLSQRVAHALADEAFAKSPALPSTKEQATRSSQRPLSAAPETRSAGSPSLRGDVARQRSQHHPTPPQSKMVSTGTMTDVSSPSAETKSSPSRPIYRFPPSEQEKRSPSLPWGLEGERSPSRPGGVPSQTTQIKKVEPQPRSSSDKFANLPSSSRPSLEAFRPSDLGDPLIRPKSATSRSRPSSLYMAMNADAPQKESLTTGTISSYQDGQPLRHSRTDTEAEIESSKTASDMDYLRAKEEEGTLLKREKRLSGSKHGKRSSLSSLSLSGTKNLLSGRFGEAFRRFEQNSSKSRTPSPPRDDHDDLLTPITGSEATGLSDERREEYDSTDFSPEMRRELERQQLAQEEERVAQAAAEYRLRAAGRGPGGLGASGGGKAPSIQNKVQSLMQENNRPPPKTASGYGRFTEAKAPSQVKQFELPRDKEHVPTLSSRPQAPIKDFKEGSASEQKPVPRFPVRPKPQLNDSKDLPPLPAGDRVREGGWDGSVSSPRTANRPTAPPKPRNLRTGGTGESGVSNYPGEQALQAGPAEAQESAVSPSDDWEANFSRRYPSLSGLDLVETEVPKISTVRTREM